MRINNVSQNGYFESRRFAEFLPFEDAQRMEGRIRIRPSP